MKKGFYFLIILFLLSSTFLSPSLTMATTQLSSTIINQDATWTLAESPYNLAGDIQVAYGATLTIEPGVVIQGNGYSLTVHGTLNASGSEASKIQFNNLQIKKGGATYTEFYSIKIEHANINGGALLPAGSGKHGTFTLRDSKVENISGYYPIYLWYPSGDSFIERNIFSNTSGISVGTDENVKVYIRNNVFYNQKDNSGKYYAVENWASYNTSATIVENNSFLSTDRMALRLKYNSGKISSAANNFWNTTNAATIDSMIYDRNDDLNLTNTISYEPYLSQSHEQTPVFSVGPTVSTTQPVNGQSKILLDQKIAITFSEDIKQGSSFGSVTLKSSSGVLVQSTMSINGKVLSIVPNTKLSPNTNYTVFIPAGGIQNLNNQPLLSSYSLKFLTTLQDQTEVSGIIGSDTTWSLAGSPYVFTGDTQLAYGSTLTIEPGVVVQGNGYSLIIHGTLNASGSETSKIQFNNLQVKPGGATYTEFYSINIGHANINGGALLPSGSGKHGTFTLRDSKVENISGYYPIYLWYPSGDSFIERNIFSNTSGISVGTSDNVKVYLRNNVFYNQKDHYGEFYAIQNWNSSGTSETIVEHNSFLSTDRVALRLKYDSGKISSAANNFWNTTNAATIDSMIYDRNDDLNLTNTISYEPYLSQSHEQTPVFSVGPTVSTTQPVNGQSKILLDQKIAITFSEDIKQGSSFGSVTLKSSSGVLVQSTMSINGKVLSIVPNTKLSPNTNYTVFIPAGGIQNLNNQPLLSSYSLKFLTTLQDQTEVSGIIGSDTTWSLAGSPYVFTGDTQLAYGSTLTIEPGVVVQGDGYSLIIHGTLNASGSETSKIQFNNLQVKPGGATYTEFYSINIGHANINGGALLPAGSGKYGTFSLRDSKVENIPGNSPIYLWYPSGDSFIERNVFSNTSGISIGTSDNVKVYIRNNVFYNQKDHYGEFYAIQNWNSSGTSETIVEHNSFLSTDRVALRLKYDSGKSSSAANNFWNTTDPSTIESMIFDKNDDAGLTSIIDYTSILHAPNTNTPLMSEVLYLLKSTPNNAQKNVSLTSKITVNFSKDFEFTEKYSEINIKDRMGNNIPIEVSKSGSILTLLPINTLKPNEKLYVQIPKGSIKDLTGAINNEYSFNFETSTQPTGLVGTFSPVKIDLSWNKSSTDIIGYKLYKSEDGLNYAKLSDILINDNSFTDENIRTGQTYYYQVTEVYQNGDESLPSRVREVKTPNPAMGWTEESTPVLFPTGKWTTYEGTSYSGGSMLLNGQKDASIELMFSGVGIRFYSLTSPWYGLADVYIDGQFIEEISMYSEKTRYTQLVFEHFNLPEGVHTLKLVNKGTIGNTLGKGINVNIDAFDIIKEKDTIPPSSPINIVGKNLIDANLLSWSPNLESDVKGYNIYRSTDSTTFLKVNSLLLTNNEFKDEEIEHGKTYHYRVTAIDLFGNESLPSEIKKVAVPVPASGWTEESISVLYPTGKWTTYEGTSYSGGSMLLNGQKDASIELVFSGVGIRLYSLTSPWYGLADVYIDGQFIEQISMYSEKTKYTQLVFEHFNLPQGVHTLKLVNKGTTGNTLGKGINVNIDAFNIIKEKDTIPPSNPINIVGKNLLDANLLSWNPNLEPDVKGYNIYRSTDSTTFLKVNSILLTNNEFKDEEIEHGKTYHYRVTAIDQFGNESLPSEIKEVSVPFPASGWTEESTPVLYPTGKWITYEGSSYSGGSMLLNGQKDASIELVFSGVGIRLYSLTSVWYGLADVYIDGQFIEQISMYSEKTKYTQLVFEHLALSQGVHTLKLVNKGTIGNTFGKGININLDAIEVF
ncbi:hypothetical protein DYI25_14535 [Mesobacillus boroniphilus]|uniref:Fibronectin type-III domain-containing protein n=1 Tax=Mesobacillus boroniphilus TaxID=308892 RepID=A0A944GYL4_9BACI|nr:Ig-like domain-containing protein [Mesobacillus boroniphilus]MBS8265641.1 hypothetical protein [Mesobacillus boroniphilus]